jgi:uncharacterized protein YecT (DUF1311 family)
MRRLFGLGVMAVLSMFVAAAPAQADPEYDQCIDESRESEFGACGAAWEEREDRRLNEAWRALLPLLDGRERAALVAEQRAWIAFNTNSCDYFYSEIWGTIGRNTWYPRCRADILIARTVQLREIKARIDSQNE